MKILIWAFIIFFSLAILACLLDNHYGWSKGNAILKTVEMA